MLTFLKYFDKVKNIKGTRNPHGKIEIVHKTAKKQGVLLSLLSFLPKKKEMPAFGKKGVLMVGCV